MKPSMNKNTPLEIELKLSVHTSAPSKLVQLLKKTALLSPIVESRQQLHNVYFDTPNQALRQARMALRLRRIGLSQSPQWIQTLKTGGASTSALSRRGEWETPVQDEQLSLPALRDSPWSSFDPDGTVFSALTAAFITRFVRTTWVVAAQDGSVVEVALDLGAIMADNHTAPICELEFELLSGHASALFEVAQDIAQVVAVIPCSRSKAERGYALAQNTLGRPLRSAPPALTKHLTLHDAARRVLGEALGQFNANLDSLRITASPEVVHQARVGWRRFKSALTLFKAPLSGSPTPPWTGLRPLLEAMGALRDLEAVTTDTLTHLKHSYLDGNAHRAKAWEAMHLLLQREIDRRRQVVLTALQAPAAGSALLTLTRWLEELAQQQQHAVPSQKQHKALRSWAELRMERLDKRLNKALKTQETTQDRHRIRILAKRLRYGIEALQPLLPKRAQRWHRRATQLQTSLGFERDVCQAAALVANLKIDRGLAEFLRGFAASQSLR
jgi:inorganic triphosphatase YgiF